MAIDYVINMDCNVKRALTQDGMINAIKDRNRAGVTMEVLQRDGKSREEAGSYRIHNVVRTPGGDVEKIVTLDEMLERARPLKDLKLHCKNCALIVNSVNSFVRNQGKGELEPFACYKSINYPISARGEEWLLGMARAALEEGAMRKLTLNYIIDQKVSGQKFKMMRAVPNNTFLERKTPLDLVVSKSILGKKVINTDQLMFMLFGFERMEQVQMVTLLFFSGAFAILFEEPKDGEYQHVIKSTNQDGKSRWIAFKEWNDPGDDQSIVQIKDFFRSMFLAYALNQEILIST